MGLSLIPSSKVSKNYIRKSQIVNALCPVYMIVWLPEMIGTWHMLTESATNHDSHRMYHSNKA